VRTRIIIMGDMVDRGPDSAPLVERIRSFATGEPNLVVLRGNHEDVMVEALRDGDETLFSQWVKYGGEATLKSWGIPHHVITGPLPSLIAAARKTIPAAVVRWMRKLPLFYRSGDFFFVHAGIRPGVSLWRQRRRDMLWIGKDFLTSKEKHPAVIVHGHSIVENGPEIHANRIALDTGAYRTGKLSAMGFEGDRQWVLST
jgi:serine/threonine protein phosphatase 1